MMENAPPRDWLPEERLAPKGDAAGSGILAGGPTPATGVAGAEPDVFSQTVRLVGCVGVTLDS